MTEELIEKARESANKNHRIPSNWNEIDIAGQDGYIKGYIAGATENGIQWHDLRKDPNDLPNDDRNVYVATLPPYKTKENVFDYHIDSWLGDDWFSSAVKDVVAWCEPHFKE